MKVDQVIRLLEAGYSKEEIQQMEQGAQESQEQETTKPEPAAEQPEQKTEPAASPESKPEEKGPAAETAPDPETGKRLDGIEAQLKQLVKSIQASNVRRDSYGSAGEDINSQADKALAALIQPHETE